MYLRIPMGLRKLDIEMHLSQIASLEPHCDCIHQFEPLAIHTFDLKYDSVSQNGTSLENELIVAFGLPRMHQHKKNS